MAGAMDMVAAARAKIESLSPAAVAEELRAGDVLLVDLREQAELARGVIPGAVLVPRGMLELHADGATPYHLDVFRKDRRLILYCSTGYRSALAVVTLQQMGYRHVAHLDGGFNAWWRSDRSVDTARRDSGRREGM